MEGPGSATIKSAAHPKYQEEEKPPRNINLKTTCKQ